MRPEEEWYQLEQTAVPAAPVDWRAIFAIVDSKGRLVDLTGDRPKKHPIPGAHKIHPGMASIGWYMSGKLANFDDGTSKGRPGTQIPGGDIYGGWRGLVVACDIDRSTVIRCRRLLRKAGWIRLTRPAGLDGQPRTHSNIYQLTIPHMYCEFSAGQAIAAGADLPLAGDLPIRGRHARV